MILVTISVILSVFFIGVQIFSLLAISQHNNDLLLETELPKVSILLAARNEEKLIIRSLKSLAQLDYPKEKLQILIGNDQSTDNTLKLIEEFIAHEPNMTVINIEKNLGKGRGKANVLAHLAHLATGEYYFITDVDVRLPKQWIKRLLIHFTPRVGIVSGTTQCESINFFSRLQSKDWLHFFGYIKAFANKGIACTSVGNNMAVRAKAYWETGGYEHIEFCITEDYKLFEAVTKNGWAWANDFNKNSLGKAWYIEDIKELLHQRKRWLIGAKELPLNWKILLIVYGLFLSAIFIIAIHSLLAAFIFWITKWLLQNIFIRKLYEIMNEPKPRIQDLITYEIYLQGLTLISAFFYILPFKTFWKGRKYSANSLD